MCPSSDGTPGGNANLSIVCGEFYLDCLRGNYFNLHPAVGNYLYNHWNTGSTLNHFWYFQNDCGTGADTPNTFAGAFTITYPVNGCEGALTYGDPEDYSAMSLTKGSTITITLAPASQANYTLCLYNPSGHQTACSNNAGYGVGESITKTITQDGSWRVEVSDVDGSGTYILSIT